MHMADALVVPAVAGTMYAASTAAAAYSIRKVRLENEPKKIPAMGRIKFCMSDYSYLNHSKLGYSRT